MSTMPPSSQHRPETDVIPIPDLMVGAHVLPTSQRTLVQGVLNVTPDSFSDGGRFFTDGHPAVAIRAGRALVAAGADIVDVGGESSRPGAEPVAVDEELRRVIPVIEALAADGVTVSIDTVKAEVARAAVAAGAQIVNDISAGMVDPDLLPTVAELDVGYVLMHMRGTPRTMQVNPTYGDVVADIAAFLAEGLDRLAALGLPSERIVVDPGIGFGKTVAHNVALLRRLREFTALGRPVLVGASRKSFLGKLTGQDDADQRLESSLAAATVAVMNGASIVRVHDVEATCRAVAVADAVTRVTASNQ